MRPSAQLGAREAGWPAEGELWSRVREQSAMNERSDPTEQLAVCVARSLAVDRAAVATEDIAHTANARTSSGAQ